MADSDLPVFVQRGRRAEAILQRLLAEGGEVHEADGHRWCSFKGGGEFDLDEEELALLRLLLARTPSEDR